MATTLRTNSIGTQIDCSIHEDGVRCLRCRLSPNQCTCRVTPSVINDLKMRDITAPKHGVNITVSPDRRTIWVNVDERCALRITQIPHLHIDNLDAAEGTES